MTSAIELAEMKGLHNFEPICSFCELPQDCPRTLNPINVLDSRLYMAAMTLTDKAYPSKSSKAALTKRPSKRRVNPEVIAKVLRGEIAIVEFETKRGPISFFLLRQLIADRLGSTSRRLIERIGAKKNQYFFFER